MHLVYLLLVLISSKKILYTPSCKKCIYYKPIYSNNIVNNLGKCSNFANKDYKTDKLEYENAKICRNDIYKCGLDGKFFINKKNDN
jgi:hypothetical protein